MWYAYSGFHPGKLATGYLIPCIMRAFFEKPRQEGNMIGTYCDVPGWHRRKYIEACARPGLKLTHGGRICRSKSWLSCACPTPCGDRLFAVYHIGITYQLVSTGKLVSCSKLPWRCAASLHRSAFAHCGFMSISECWTDQNNPEDSKNVGYEADNLSSAALKWNKPARRYQKSLQKGHS